MNQDYIKPDGWSIIEEGFEKDRVKTSESLFSIGNGAMGQRANFEEHYSGPTLRGSYIGGVYYPYETRVGWWKVGYPETSAKMLNAPIWIGIEVVINEEALDLNTCKDVSEFRRELNMKEGWYRRSFKVTLQNGLKVKVISTRFLSMDMDELGVINYEIELLSGSATVIYRPYLDSGVANADSSPDERFWETQEVRSEDSRGFITSKTLKSNFYVCSFMESQLYLNKEKINRPFKEKKEENKITFSYAVEAEKGDKVGIHKFGGYVSDRKYGREKLSTVAEGVLSKGVEKGYEKLLEIQKKSWEAIWEMADIIIEGDVKAQQGIRFNIFQLNQTYLGKQENLNIGPKGFTGEKYGGGAYWDTEAYCIPFYMATRDQKVARNLLTFRYNHLDKAIENAEKLGFSNGAALYPMATMDGEENHNEWEITFEEIHRNGAVVFAIYNYVRYTGDFEYITEKGLEVMIAVARFWKQRANFSKIKNKYVILGVTGPNEYENNVNNNWYTNYIAKWCLEHCTAMVKKVKDGYRADFERIKGHTNLSYTEVLKWKEIAEEMYFPFSKEHGIFLQQDNFLDKEIIPARELDRNQRPLNQHWSWDRILRSCYIKQADVLQGFYFFEDHFSEKELEKHFDFYEPLTVHESSLSPCVHSIQAAKLGRMDKAYELYLRTSRLDLDDYNYEVEEGCHITSMAGTWMSIVEGFGGMRVKDDVLCFQPKIPHQWNSYSFKLNFRNQIITVKVHPEETVFSLDGDEIMEIEVRGKKVTLEPNREVKV